MLYSATSREGAAPLGVSATSAIEASSVWLSDLSLTRFRNYGELRLSLDARRVVLTGANGAGKTNLMEAISLLAPGRGLRRAKIAQMACHDCGEQGWTVSAQVETEEGSLRAGTGIVANEEDDEEASRRIIRINGEPAAQMDLAERFAVSWLTPEMDQVLGDSPSARRKFLDRLVIAFDPAHTGRLQRYDKATRQRSRLLDEGKGDEAWFEALETEIATSGVAIVAARKSLVEALDTEAQKPLEEFPSAQLELRGEAEEWMDSMPAVEVEDRIKAEAKEARLRGEKTILGASKSILITRHSDTGQDAESSSTGEQKALVISVILAHAQLQANRLSHPPLLLLDDIASHLDEARRESLFEVTSSLKGQVWFSGTDQENFKIPLKDSQHIEIEEGRLCA